MTSQRSHKLLNKTLKWGLRLAGPLILIALLISVVDVSQMIQAVLSADVRILIAALFMFPLAIPIRAWRWKNIMRVFDISYGWGNTLLTYLIGVSGQFFLPSGFGDTIRGFYLLEEGHSASRSFMTVLLDKSFEYLATLFFGVTGFVFFSAMLTIEWQNASKWALIVLLVLCVLVGIIVFFRCRVRTLVGKLIETCLGAKVKRMTGRAVKEVWAGFQALTVADLMWFVFLSLLAGLVRFFSFYLLTRSLELELGYAQVVAMMGIVGIAVNIPFIAVSFGGIGIRDGVLYALFSALGESPEAAIAFSLLIWLVATSWRSIGALVWFVRPLDVGELTRRARMWREKTTEQKQPNSMGCCPK